jgi:hypothetical protein
MFVFQEISTNNIDNCELSIQSSQAVENEKSEFQILTGFDWMVQAWTRHAPTQLRQNQNPTATKHNQQTNLNSLERTQLNNNFFRQQRDGQQHDGTERSIELGGYEERIPDFSWCKRGPLKGNQQ